MYGLRRFRSRAFCASVRRGVGCRCWEAARTSWATPGRRSLQWSIVVMALGVDTAGPDESNCVNMASS